MNGSVSFGGWLKQRRKALDLRQEDLAELVGCAMMTIQKIEAGERRPSRQVAELLAARLKIPQDEWPAFVRFARLAVDARTVADNAINEQAPWRTLHHYRTNLPVEPTPLIGREQHVAALGDLLQRERVRLVTLLGPPGIGKTSLSIEVATELLEHFDDGVFFVALAPIGDVSLVVATIAATLDVREVGNQSMRSRLHTWLRDKRILLVLDNFEHVVDAASEVSALLASCPWLKVLTTSRQPLHVRGEQQYSVPPLGHPVLGSEGALRVTCESAAAYPAVALFVARAQAVQRDFDLTPEIAQIVAMICARLDGLPLAIELAAAQVRSMSPQALHARLDHRLRLLTSGPRDLPERQQTLQAAIGWSYDLLNLGEQMLFARLGVFVGGCTLPAAEAVSNASRDLPLGMPEAMAALLDKSLLRRQAPRDGDDDNDARFTMLETILEYAREQLLARGEVEAIRRQHATYYLALAEAAELQLYGSDQKSWLDRLERDHDNLRAALRWAVETEALELAVRLGRALWRFWWMHSHLTDGRWWVEHVLPFRGRLSPDLAAQALHTAAALAYAHGDHARAIELFEETLLLYRALSNTTRMADVLSNLGMLVSGQGDHTRAMVLLQEGLALHQQLEDKPGITVSLGSLGDNAYYRGDYAQAEAYYTASLGLARELANTFDIAIYLHNLGDVYRCQGTYGRARSCHQESLALFRTLEIPYAIGRSLNSLAETARYSGDHVTAGALYRESLALHRELKSTQQIGLNLVGVAAIAVVQRQLERAARLLGAAEGLLVVDTAPLAPPERADYERTLTAVQGILDPAAFAVAWAAGQTMTVDEAIAYALDSMTPESG